jgi:hypothetical protein
MAQRKQSSAIQDFITDFVAEHAAVSGLAGIVSARYGISAQAANKHVRHLEGEGVLTGTGNTSHRIYSLKSTEYNYELSLLKPLEEHVVWAEHVEPFIKDQLEPNVFAIVRHIFLEMFNNAIDHSQGTSVKLMVIMNKTYVTMSLGDDGIGIFEKIKSHFGLAHHQQAILELSKGKLTTAAERHSGEGIFFSSRMADLFAITSNHLWFTLRNASGDDHKLLIEHPEGQDRGTSVMWKVSTKSKMDLKEVFDRYSSDDDAYSFNKTHVPVRLARYEGESLVSRSQARRLLARFDRFSEVWLDFSGVSFIGQAFADEVFRVFATENPNVKIIYTDASTEVEAMISRARHALGSPSVREQPPA